jgi:hypothetical protein
MRNIIGITVIVFISFIDIIIVIVIKQIIIIIYFTEIENVCYEVTIFDSVSKNNILPF